LPIRRLRRGPFEAQRALIAVDSVAAIDHDAIGLAVQSSQTASALSPPI